MNSKKHLWSHTVSEIRNPEVGQVTGSSSGSFKSLQSSCWLELQTLKMEESLPGSLTCCWLWAFVPHQVCLSIQNLASPGKWYQTSVFYDLTLSEVPSTLPYSVGHMPVLAMVGVTGAILEAKHFWSICNILVAFLVLVLAETVLCITSLNALNILQSRCNWGIEMLSNFPKLFLSNRPWIKT